MLQKRKLLFVVLGLFFFVLLSVVVVDVFFLQGKIIGVVVVGIQYFWDCEVFKGVIEEVEKLGGKVIGVDGGCDNQVYVNNYDILLLCKVDVVISIFGDSVVELKFKVLCDVGILVFIVDYVF